MMRLRHGGRLVREFVGFAVVNRAWWVLPVVAALALAALAISVAQAAAPYTVYTIF